jgi:hypothetical protein
MLTAIIRSSSGPEALVVTMRSLVPAVLAGVVARVCVAHAHAEQAIAEIAEAAGADHAAGDTAEDALQALVIQHGTDPRLLIDAGLALPEQSHGALALAARGQVVAASTPTQMGFRGFLQRILGRVTSDQVLVLPAGQAPERPLQQRYGQALHIMPFRCERLPL